MIHHIILCHRHRIQKKGLKGDVKVQILQTSSLFCDNTSVNNISTLILHICRGQDIITKTIHHAINGVSTKAELFAIKYGINYTTQMQDIIYIIVITDAIFITKHIFDMSIHPYQLHFITISNNLRDFLNKNSSNVISLWDCSSSNKWPHHLLVDKMIQNKSCLTKKIIMEVQQKRRMQLHCLQMADVLPNIRL